MESHISSFSRIQIFYLFLLISISIKSLNGLKQVGKSTPLIFLEEVDSDLLFFERGDDFAPRKVGVKERIVTSLVSLDLGVPIDYRYNQTRKHRKETVSAPGCPKATQGQPWVHHGSPPKCVMVGFRGTCPLGQRVFRAENPNFGICNCDCFSRKQTPTSKPSARFQFCFSSTYQRQVVFDRLTQNCHLFLDQGPCKRDEWLVKDLSKEDSILCESRKCPEFNFGEIDHFGRIFTYFDYQRQECFTHVLEIPKPSFFYDGRNMKNRYTFCEEAGMKYSSIQKTCVKDDLSKVEFSTIR